MATATYIQQAYLAYFGRPVDANGAVAYANVSNAQLQASFSASAESQALYGPTFDRAQVNAIYTLLFGRPAEQAGADYWLNQVVIGAVTPAGAAVAILNGALGGDITVINNKLAASAAFSTGLDTTAERTGYSGAAAAALASAFLKGVTTAPPSSAEVTAAVAKMVAGSDGISGGAGVDTITYNLAADGTKYINLGGGQDVINLSANGATEIRLTLTDGNVGNGNGTGSANTVKLQAQNSAGALTGNIGYADDEGTTFVAGGNTRFFVRDGLDISPDAKFNVVALGASAADNFDFSASKDNVYVNAGQGNDTVMGGSGKNYLSGGAGNDTLTNGNGGGNIIGGQGADVLTGGASEDFFVYSTGDVGMNESINGGAGTDMIGVLTSTDFTNLSTATILTAGSIERVVIVGGQTATFTGSQLTGQAIAVNAFTFPLTTPAPATLSVNVLGTTAVSLAMLKFTAFGDGPEAFDSGANRITIQGDAADNTITGTSMADTITGGAGADRITLGSGRDTLVFNSLSGADIIADYVVADDSIQLSAAVFTTLGSVGALAATSFESGAGLKAAATAAGRVVYDTSTGNLYYDADGSGSAVAAVLVGTFTNAPTLVAGEFSIIA
jgi:Ca2+-binding RTX toxin-like protein